MVPKTDAWFRTVFYHESEERFRTHFRVIRSTFLVVKSSLLLHAESVLLRRRGGGQLQLDLQLSITLFRLGHYGNASAVDVVAVMFGVSVGAVIKCTRRVVTTLAGNAPQHVQWPDMRRRAALSSFAKEAYGFDWCIGATDGTTSPLAYQPALHPWVYFDRKQWYSVSGLITCDWDCYITNIVLGCTGAAPDTYVQATAEWHCRPNIFFTAGQYLLGDRGMLYSRNVVGVAVLTPR